MKIEATWDSEWFAQLPHQFWKKEENRKNFFDQFAHKHGIKNPKDWGKITTRMVKSEGGSTMLRYYFDSSLFSALQSTYPGISLRKMNSKI